MSKGTTAHFVCAACGLTIGVYERCLVTVGGEARETSWLSLTPDEREHAEAMRVYHRECYARGIDSRSS